MTTNMKWRLCLAQDVLRTKYRKEELGCLLGAHLVRTRRNVQLNMEALQYRIADQLHFFFSFFWRHRLYGHFPKNDVRLQR